MWGIILSVGCIMVDVAIIYYQSLPAEISITLASVIDQFLLAKYAYYTLIVCAGAFPPLIIICRLARALNYLWRPLSCVLLITLTASSGTIAWVYYTEKHNLNYKEMEQIYDDNNRFNDGLTPWY